MKANIFFKNKILFLLSMVVVLAVFFSFTSPRYTPFIIKNQAGVDMPSIQEGQEVEYFGDKYSKTNGIIVNAPTSISCMWKDPEIDDGYKVCEVIFKIDGGSFGKKVLENPKVELNFKGKNNAKNLKIYYSKQYVVKENSYDKTESKVVDVASSPKVSGKSFITGNVVNVPETKKNKRKIKKPSKPAKKLIVEEKKTVLKKREFNNFFEISSSIVQKKNNDSGVANVTKDNSTSINKSVVDASSKKASNETLGNNSIVQNSSATNFSFSNETLNNANNGPNNSNFSDVNVSQLNSSSKKNNGTFINFNESLLASNKTNGVRNFSNSSKNISNPILDFFIGFFNRNFLTGNVVGGGNEDIDSSKPFAVKVVFEIPKYESNFFDFKISEKDFEAHLDPAVSSCGTLNSVGATYFLDSDLNSSDTCFTIDANNITLNCQGHTINYSSVSSVGRAIYSTGNYTTIKNCILMEVSNGVTPGDAIYFSNSNNGTIENNTIVSLYNSRRGISLLDSSGNSISNNFVNVSGASAINIYLNSNSVANNLTANVINNFGSGGVGIYFVPTTQLSMVDSNVINVMNSNSQGIYGESTPNLNIKNNIIYDYSDGYYGIYYESGTGSNFTNNTIYASYPSSSGIYLSTDSLFTFVNNTIILSGSGVLGLYLDGSTNISVINGDVNVSAILGTAYFFDGGADYFSLSDSTIHLMGNGSVGVYSESVNYPNISSNVFYVNEGANNSWGIFMEYTSNPLIERNNFTVSGETGGRGVSFTEAIGAKMNNNNLVFGSGNKYGLYLDSTSRENNVSNNNFTGEGDSLVFLNGSYSNSFSSNYLFSNGTNTKGVSFGSFTYNNSFYVESISTSGASAYPVYVLGSSNNFSFYNSTIDALGVSYDLYLPNLSNVGNWEFVNSTLDDTYFGSSTSGNLSVYWYVDAITNYSNGTLLQGVNVSSYDNLDNLIFSEVTNSNGSILKRKLLEYRQLNKTYKNYLTNYTFNASYLGENLSREINLTTNKNVIFTFGVSNSESSSSVGSSSGSGGRGHSGGFAGSVDCKIKWKCSKWSNCEEGKTKRSCEKKNPECTIGNEPRSEKVCNDKKTKKNKKTLFDIILDPIKKNIGSGETFSSKVTLINLGVPGRVNASLYYEIVNSNDEVVYSEEEVVQVETQLEFIKEIDTSSFEDGEYEILVNLEYGGQTEPAESKETFYIGEIKKNYYGYYFLFGLIVLAVALFYYLKKRKKPSETYFELVKRLSHIKDKRKVYPEIKKKYHYLERREKERIYPKIKKIFKLKD